MSPLPAAAVPPPPAGEEGDPRPIGVFDSGVGGLTVASALRKLLPHETILYVGDTARVPYGGKSAQTIERYSLEISALLRREGAKMIVVACNTASALAIPRLETGFDLPVTGVILPGAQAAVAATRLGRIGVIGTHGTIRSRAYEKAIAALDPTVQVESRACPMLVPAIEEGWLEDPLTDRIIARYLDDLLASGIDTLVLGCTHYPLLRTAFERYCGGEIRLVDSAENCALAVQTLLARHGLATPRTEPGRLDVALTDAIDGFLPVAQRALGLQPDRLRVIDSASLAL